MEVCWWPDGIEGLAGSIPWRSRRVSSGSFLVFFQGVRHGDGFSHVSRGAVESRRPQILRSGLLSQECCTILWTWLSAVELPKSRR